MSWEDRVALCQRGRRWQGIRETRIVYLHLLPGVAALVVGHGEEKTIEKFRAVSVDSRPVYECTRLKELVFLKDSHPAKAG